MATLNKFQRYNQTNSNLTSLIPVSEIPEQYQSVFSSFPYFNRVQSTIFDDVFYTNKTLTICAPTGSGKTVVFELAIVRMLMKIDETGGHYCNRKVVYVAPIKALCNERFEDWKKKFDPLGVFCIQLTGDSDSDDYFQLQKFTIILTTPEKWDNLTRRWRENEKVMKAIKLFIIDEIHLLNEDQRGATLEATLSRMKAIQSSFTNPDVEDLRFISASATLPNAEDISKWLSMNDMEGISHKLGEEMRPIKLNKVVLGYPFSEKMTEFRFELSLNYKLPNVIATYSEGKPVLVFCSTRKGVIQTAETLAKQSSYIYDQKHREILLQSIATIKDIKLKGTLSSGIGYHHAGLIYSDRKTIEQLFLNFSLPVLISTSTLAMGVNFPAHLVIVKSTTQYISGCFKEYPETQILQMTGRAGRPQFDTTATAVIMTKTSLKEKYQKLINGTSAIESSLHKCIAEHLNAEIVSGSVSDKAMAKQWLMSTFLYIRMFKNPAHYGINPNLSREEVEKKFHDVFLKEIDELALHNLIKVVDNFYLQPTEIGRLLVKYYMSFETMKHFSNLLGNETLPQLLNVISECKELEEVQLRVHEKQILNAYNKSNQPQRIRFPFREKIKTRAMKINCLMQAVFGCLPIQDIGLNQEAARIRTIGLKVSQCLSDYLTAEAKGFQAAYYSLLLTKSFKTRLWENSKHVARQINGIGIILSNILVNAGLMNFEAICQTNARELEMLLNKNPPFGSTLIESITHLPSYMLAVEQVGPHGADTASLLITVSVQNFEFLQDRCTAHHHSSTLIVGDQDNKLLTHQKIMDASILRLGKWTRKLDLKRALKGDEIDVCLISTDYDSKEFTS